MRLYDALLVNPVVDGMNLVAKEGPVVNTKEGVLVLSESAGAYEELCTGVLGVSPADLEGTAQALYEAVTMSVEERGRRAAILQQIIEQQNVTHWHLSQFQDIRALLD